MKLLDVLLVTVLWIVLGWLPIGAPAGAGPGNFPSSMECVKVFEDRWRCTFR